MPAATARAREELEFRLGFDVEAVDAGGQREVHLARRLADAGEHDLLGRDAGGQRAAQFAFRDHVRAGAEAGQRLQHGLVGIGLHRVADQRVDVGEGLGKDLVMALQRRRRIAIEGRADGLGDFGDRHVFGVKRRRRDSRNGSPWVPERRSDQRIEDEVACPCGRLHRRLYRLVCAACRTPGGSSRSPLRPQPASTVKAPARRRQRPACVSAFFPCSPVRRRSVLRSSL